MTFESDQSSLRRYVSKQLENMFPVFNTDYVIDDSAFLFSLQQTKVCLAGIKIAAKNEFNPFVSWQYAIFLHYLSRQIWLTNGDGEAATRVFLLNKALNGIDLYYQIEMPQVFVLGHTVGLVFAKAVYGNYCVFHQNCTVGRDGDKRPVLENGVILYPNSCVIGKCLVRENTVLTPGLQLVNTDTPGNCIVVPNPRGGVMFKEAKEYYADRYVHWLS